jgi:hypothetical protein
MTIYQIMEGAYGGYVVALALVCVAATVQGREDLSRLWRGLLAMDPLRRTAAVLATNCALNAVFVQTTGVHDAAVWFFAVDAVSAFLVLYPPAKRAQAMIGSVYIAQMIMHIVYLVSDPTLAANRYWQVLFALAVVQLVILGGWAGGYHWRRFDHSGRRRGHRGTRVDGAGRVEG